ncbi:MULTISPECIES: H-NS histone family protein [Burkholderia]|uniref:H-NS histone family protein n=1 Tax=Burkholderia TaxID=32008 RepID=UPI001F4241A9|nr:MULTISPECIES: H-NS histone family protein [Burkholderia]
MIRSVAAIAASGAGHPAAEQLTWHESGHFYVAKSGHFNLAATTKIVDNYDYVKLRIPNEFDHRYQDHDWSRQRHDSQADALAREAENARPAELDAIIGSIREQIAAYGNTPDQIFGRRRTAASGEQDDTSDDTPPFYLGPQEKAISGLRRLTEKTQGDQRPPRAT